MNRTIAAIAMLATLARVSPAAESAPKAESTPGERQTYESPILTLLLLPVNVLIKAASVLGPGEKPAARAHGDDEGSRTPR